MGKVLRVFPRRTSYTPDDSDAFVGNPPLWLPSDVSNVHVSCTFSWDVAEAERLVKAWEQHYPGRVQVGGPAWGSFSKGFTPGRYVRQGVTFTSRGCSRRCPFCLVPEREGVISLINPTPPGYIVQDNNFLATPLEHRRQVYEMLGQQKRAAVFAGGLDARLLTQRIADELRQVRIAAVFLAADTAGALKILARVRPRLDWLPRRKVRCYLLCGFGDDAPEWAEQRLEQAWQIGVLPFVQLYQPENRSIEYGPEWRALQRKWSRPAAMFASH